ncbi:hypothetical protein HUT08_17035 [Streptomyces buecherae]|uniref:Protein spdB n=1 Tax=Streptomyces buecherae TaxID=2763006 RepID=A0A7H8N9H0_9ACTN|nr:hypothetical protein HUT08_17035 [Streptomyces buecherae]
MSAAYQQEAKTALPAIAMTAVSMVLTLAVVMMWLGPVMPWPVALVVGLGIDGGWLAVLAYDRRLAAQGDHSMPVTVVGWIFGLVATAVLVAHAVNEESPGAWLAVAWLPLAAKGLWVVHGLWERTALTGDALHAIRSIQQEARDEAATARARLRAKAGTEETRLLAVVGAGAAVAQVQAKTARSLARAWGKLESAHRGEATGRALASIAPPIGLSDAGWDLPVWGPTVPVDPHPTPSGTNAEESADLVMDRSTSDLGGSTPPVVRLDRLSVPDPVAATATKSASLLKPLPDAARVDESSGVPPIGSSARKAIAADARRPRRVTGKVPDAARTPRGRRTDAQLLAEARTLMPGEQVTAEGIRLALHVAPKRARRLRDELLAERATASESAP